MRAAHTTIKYDGPALRDHAMDVAHLAPALLALSELVKDANRFANGDRAGVKVLVSADLEQKCFELAVQLVMTIWEQPKLLIGDEDVRSAKEIAEWLGILGIPTGVVGVGLFRLIKRLRGQRVASTTVVRVADGRNVVEIRTEGEAEPVQVAEAVYGLYSNVATRQKALAVLAPLREEGYDSLEFYDGNDGHETAVRFEKDDVPAPDFSDLPEVVPQNKHTSTIRTEVKIRKAAYEGKSCWTLMYKRAIEASIDDEDWLARSQSGQESAPPGNYLDVNRRRRTSRTRRTSSWASPRIGKKVHRVTQPPEQRLLFRNDGSGYAPYR
jgi:hypothetical protein